MNDILKDIETLKNKILDSDEYKDFKKYENILDNNEEISNLINKGYNYKEILTYYYPNTYISKFS